MRIVKFIVASWKIKGVLSVVGNFIGQPVTLILWDFFREAPLYYQIPIGIGVSLLIITVVVLLVELIKRFMVLNSSSRRLGTQVAETHADISYVNQFQNKDSDNTNVIFGDRIDKQNIYHESNQPPPKMPSLIVTPYFEGRYANLIIENVGDTASFAARILNLNGIKVNNPEGRLPAGYYIRWFGNLPDTRRFEVVRDETAVLEVFDAHSHKLIPAIESETGEAYDVQQVNLFSYNRTFDGEMETGGTVTFSLRITSEPEMETPFNMKYKLVCGEKETWTEFEEIN